MLQLLNAKKIFFFLIFRSMLQFIAIKRRDTGEWALPGGMVDPGEKVAATAIREFQEEALNSLELSPGILYNIHYKES